VTQSNTPTQITCKLGLNSGLIPNTAYALEVMILNQGYALQSDYFRVNFLPAISSVSKNEGSISGGTQVTINGDGFTPSLTSLILDLSLYSLLSNANNIQIAYTSISLTTLQDQSGTFPLNINVNGVAAVCEGAALNCNFTFSSSSTPTLTAITPSSLSVANTVFTLSGATFGTDLTKVHVTIGEIGCQVTSVTDTSIECTLANLNLGAQSVNVLIDGK